MTNPSTTPTDQNTSSNLPLTDAELNEVIRRATENFLTSAQINERIAAAETGALTDRLRDGLEALLGHTAINGTVTVTDEHPAGIGVAINETVPLTVEGVGEWVVLNGESTDATYENGHYSLSFDYGGRSTDDEYLIIIRDRSGDVYRQYSTGDLRPTMGTDLYHLGVTYDSFKRVFIRSSDTFEVKAVARGTTLEFDSGVTLANAADVGLTTEEVFAPNWTIENIDELLTRRTLGRVRVDIILANHNEIHGITPGVLGGVGGRIQGILVKFSDGDGRLVIFHQSNPANIYIQARPGDDFVNILADTTAQISDIRTKAEALQARVGVVESAVQGGVPLPENLAALDRALTITPGTGQEWHKADPFPGAESELLYATLLGERRFSLSDPLEIDAITGQDDTVLAGIEERHITFYTDPHHPLNFSMPGFSSHINQTEINIHRDGNASFLRELNDNFIISFDYALQEEFWDEDVDLLSFGSTATAVLGLSNEGLYFNLAGPGNGQMVDTQVSGDLYQDPDGARSYEYGLATDGAVGPAVYFVVQDNFQSPMTVNIRMDVAQNGVSLGESTSSYTINRLDTDQTFPNLTFQILNLPPYEGEVRYIADHNGRRVIRFRPLTSQHPVYAYILSMSYEYTVQVGDVTGVRYRRQQILSRDDHNQFGLFNPLLDDELQEYVPNNVIVEIKQGADGYMLARAVINGTPQNDGAFIRLRRTAEDLGIPALTADGAGNGIRLGNDIMSISRFYAIKNRRPLTSDQLLQIHAHINSPGISYYTRRAADDRYSIAGIVQGYDSNGNLVDLAGGGGGAVDLTKIRADIAALQSAAPKASPRLVVVEKTAEDAAREEPIGAVIQYPINKDVARAHRKISIRMESASAGTEVRESEFNTTALADGKVLRIGGGSTAVISENETEWLVERSHSGDKDYHITEIVL